MNEDTDHSENIGSSGNTGDKSGRRFEEYAKRTEVPEFSCSRAAPISALCSRPVSPYLTIPALLPHMNDDCRAVLQKQLRVLSMDMLRNR